MNSIVVKIIIPFTLLVLVVVGILATFNYITTRDALTASANQNLLAAARQTVNSLRNYINSTSTFLDYEVEAHGDIYNAYLGLPEAARRNTPEEHAVEERLTNLAASRRIVAYALLDRDGRAWLESDIPTEKVGTLPLNLGIDLTDSNYRNKVLLTGVPFISPVIFDPRYTTPVIFFVSRIRDSHGAPIGMLVAIHEASALQEQIILSTGMAGESSYAVLVDENRLRLAHGVNFAAIDTFITPPEPETLQKLIAARRVPADSLNRISETYPDFAAGLDASREQPFFSTHESTIENEINSAAAVFIPETNWSVVFMQPQRVFLRPVNQQTITTVILAGLVAILAVIAALIIGRLITRPILALTAVAEKVATGDLNVRAEVNTGFFSSPDELGTLGLAFNVMNARQRQTLEELEARVEARTQDLAKASEQMKYRLVQLQTVSEVARAIASESDLDRLLPLITHTIADRFGFYHVGIFLLDEAGEYAVLQAANSEGGQRMLARHHRLKVGQVGIIGFATAHDQPRLALDVGKDAVYFNNPDLPSTRSEIGLPLKVGGKVIGALDAQSTEPSAFTQEDVTLLTTLADQVAIAIENARLFSETRRALAEAQASQREYLQQGWSRLTTSVQQLGYRYQQGHLLPIQIEDSAHAAGESGDGSEALVTEELWQSLEQQGFVIKPVSSSSNPASSLFVPISLRGQVIGLIDLHETDPDRTWSDEEISLARAIAEQVGLALENARLIDETQRRLQREQLVSEITTRLRTSNDPQVILQTAAAELRQALRARTAQVIVHSRQRFVEMEDSTSQNPARQDGEPETEEPKEP